MGCSASRPNCPYNEPFISTSSHPINPQRTSQTSILLPFTNRIHCSVQAPQQHSDRHTSPQRFAPRIALNERLNQPLLIPHHWTSKERTWTRRELDCEREEFFDTRVTGRPECWQTLHAALQLLWAGGNPGLSGDADLILATAQLMIQAAGMTLPKGDMVSEVYDMNGAMYHLPEYIVSDPTNIVVEDEGGCQNSGDKGDDSGYRVEVEEEAATMGQEKGKATSALEDTISVKARLSDRGGPAADIVVDIGKGESVRLLAKRVFEEAELRPTQRVRIIYMGKMLKENETLLTQDWKDNHIVNALILDTQAS